MTISNKKFIEIVEKEKLLDGLSSHNINLKKSLLKWLGFEYLRQDNGSHIKVEGATPNIVALHLKGAYYCALREEGLL